jgi:hypothetical protein
VASCASCASVKWSSSFDASSDADTSIACKGGAG